MLKAFKVWLHNWYMGIWMEDVIFWIGMSILIIMFLGLILLRLSAAGLV